ncbi:MAG: hypothetical protein R3D27_12295 [Hyphomicrobiaceae bacterium]
MPQLIVLGVIGAGALVGLRALSRYTRRIAEAAERAAARAEAERRAAREPRDLGSLEIDPSSGEYRPRKA